LGAVLAWCLFLMIRSEATEDVERQLYPTLHELALDVHGTSLTGPLQSLLELSSWS